MYRLTLSRLGVGVLSIHAVEKSDLKSQIFTVGLPHAMLHILGSNQPQVVKGYSMYLVEKKKSIYKCTLTVLNLVL